MTEGSRGCWWGEKHSCTFCGLNGIIKTYRAKTPERIADELEYLTGRYGNQTIFFSDNIMSREAEIELPELLRGRKEKMHLFTEIKSNLNDSDVKALSEAGFFQLQPGIESLSDPVLKLMNKGNTAICHIALLKYAEKYSVRLAWNILYGFPGEKTEAYEELCELIPLIEHLPSPTGGMNRIAYHRNSVYVNDPEKYSLELKPDPMYDFYLPDDEQYINDYAYAFVDHSPQNEQYKHTVYGKVRDMITHWQNSFIREHKIRLDMIVFENSIEIHDSRSVRVKDSYEFEGLPKDIYLLCNEPKSHHTIISALTEKNYSEDEIDKCLKELQDLKLLLKIRDEFLALAVERPGDYMFRWMFQ